MTRRIERKNDLNSIDESLELAPSRSYLTGATRKETSGGTDSNRPPYAISLSANATPEDSANGAVVGQLTARDPDRRESFSFTLISDPSGVFAIDAQGRLIVADRGGLDFETAPILGIVVQVTDRYGAAYRQELSIFVTDVAEAPDAAAPTDILLSNAAVAENSAAGSLVGRLSAVDPDGDTAFVFTLIDDAGGMFAVNGDRLEVARSGGPDYETADAHLVIVEATDPAGLSVRKSIAIAVIDVSEGDPAATAPARAIEGLLPGGSVETAPRWNAASGLGAPVTVSLAFAAAVPAYYGATAPERTAFAPFSESQRAAARDALQQIAGFTRVDFVETAAADAQIVFGTADLPRGVAPGPMRPAQPAPRATCGSTTGSAPTRT
jgi:hypothetical protein